MNIFIFAVNALEGFGDPMNPFNYQGFGKEKSVNLTPNFKAADKEKIVNQNPNFETFGKENHVNQTPSNQVVGKEKSVNRTPNYQVVGKEKSVNQTTNYQPYGEENSINQTPNFEEFGKEKTIDQTPKPSKSNRNNRLLVFSKKNNLDDLQKLRAEAIKQSTALASEEHAMKKELHERNLKKIDLECTLLELNILEKQCKLKN